MFLVGLPAPPNLEQETLDILAFELWQRGCRQDATGEEDCSNFAELCRTDGLKKKSAHKRTARKRRAEPAVMPDKPAESAAAPPEPVIPSVA